MRESTREKILHYIKKNTQASGKELVDYLVDISDRGVRKQLKTLLDTGIVEKTGKPPRVYYLLSRQKHLVQTAHNSKEKKVIDARYVYISPAGEMTKGWDGFVAWCQKTKQDPQKTAGEYVKTLLRYDRFRKEGLIDATKKLKETFDQVFLDRLFYIDFYSIERFGKTKLGQMLLYAKQSQDRVLIRNVVHDVRPILEATVKKHAIDGVLFVPPTVKREVQFMKELEKQLHLLARSLAVEKIKTAVVVPQKTLTKLEDRIENARKTIVVTEKGKYKNILLIDDAVGSGATLNETAGQIRRLGLASGKIIGLSIAGSFNGFDVISEV